MEATRVQSPTVLSESDQDVSYPSDNNDDTDDESSDAENEPLTAPAAAENLAHPQVTPPRAGLKEKIRLQFQGSRYSSELLRRLPVWFPGRNNEYDHIGGTGPVGGHRSSNVALDLLRGLTSMLFSSWLNVLIVFVPIGLAAYLLKAPSVVTFITNSIAIVPLSSLLTDATERVANDAGDTIGALLNISLGNLVELILFVALMNGHVRIVQASILGSILVNLLLILGSALLACSMTDLETSYSTSGTQLLGSLLFVSVFAFLMPTAFDYSFRQYDGSEHSILQMSRISACMVLVIYISYVIHELKSPTKNNKDAIEDLDIERRQVEMPQPHVPPNRTSTPLPLPPRTIRFAEEDLTNDVTYEDSNLANPPRIELDEVHGDDVRRSMDSDVSEERGRQSYDQEPQMFGARESSYRRMPLPRGHSRSISLGSSYGARSRDSSLGSDGRRVLMRSALPTLRVMRSSFEDLDCAGYEQTRPMQKKSSAVDRAVSILVLILSSAIMSMCAEFLVSAIDDVTHQGHLSEAVIGLIILPIVGNIAEYITVVTVAVKEKLDLAIAVAVGSSIQIALCVTPLTVIAGWILQRDLVLTFNFFEMATLVGSALVVNLVILSEGPSGPRSNALRGGLICGCYAIIGIGAVLAPGDDEA